MTMGTNVSAPIGSAFNSVIGPAPSFVVGPAPDSVTNFALNPITGLIPGVVAVRIPFVMIDPKKSYYFYEKQVMVKNLTSYKLYMKGTIWIRGILFGEISKAWKYMLGISDETQKAEMTRNFGQQFIFLVKKIGDEYQQFSDLVKYTWKETSIAKDTMTNIIMRLRPYITASKKNGVFYSKILVAIDKY